MSNELEKRLSVCNEAQAEAISHEKGPALVLAGPGSGKTFVITMRLQYLIQVLQVNPSSILVISFTKASAHEMWMRSVNMTPETRHTAFGTFHSVFYEIIQSIPKYKSYSILFHYEKQEILKTILYHFSFQPNHARTLIPQLLKEIGEFKNLEVLGQTYTPQIMEEEIFMKIYKEYQKECLERQKLDFDDMLILCYKELRDRKDIAALWQNRFQYVLIDEFQDINMIQYRTILLLVKQNRNLFVVGDDDQSIYGFRGASPGIMKTYLRDFPEAKQILLNINYRCSGNILNMALHSISHNKERFLKEIQAEKQPGEGGAIQKFSNETEQAIAVIKTLSLEHLDQNAILVRTNAGASYIAEKLYEQGIPYEMKEAEDNFYDKQEIAGVLAYLRFAFQKPSRYYFLQFMNKPERYIRREMLEEEDVCFSLLEGRVGNEFVRNKLCKLKEEINFLKKLDPYAAVLYIKKAMGYEHYCFAQADSNDEKKKEMEDNFCELGRRAKEFHSVISWLSFIDSYTENFERKKNKKQQKKTCNVRKKAVRIMTYHGSKGLEFEHVFLIYLNGGYVPHPKAMLPEDVEEERRMFYVAMTRAKEKLHLYYIENNVMQPSPFLEELRTPPKRYP